MFLTLILNQVILIDDLADTCFTLLNAVSTQDPLPFVITVRVTIVTNTTTILVTIITITTIITIATITTITMMIFR